MARKAHQIPDGFGVIVKNGDIITRLSDSRSDKDELADSCGLSTKTVYRRMRELMERDYVRKDGHKYSLTTVGAFYARILQEDFEVFDVIDENQNLFSNVESSTFPRFLVLGAKIIRQETNFSTTISEYVHENLPEPSSVRAVFGQFSRRHVATLRQWSAVPDSKIILDVDDYVDIERQHPEKLEDLHDLVTEVRSARVPFPHSILQLDESNVIVELNTDQGHEKALLINSGWKVREWATNKFESYSGTKSSP